MMITKRTDNGYCSIAAIRFAQVLSGLPVEEEAISETGRIFQEVPELIGILDNPLIEREKKKRVIDRIFPAGVITFLKVLMKHHKVYLIQEIMEAYEIQRKSETGCASALLCYVVLPSDVQKAKMEHFIKQKFHVDKVVWSMKKDPGLIGGFILCVKGTKYDYSIKGRLDRLERKLTWR